MKEGVITIAQEADNLEKSKTTKAFERCQSTRIYTLWLAGMELDKYPFSHYVVFGRPK